MNIHQAKLEFGPRYILHTLVIGEKVEGDNGIRTPWEDRPIPEGTHFVVENWGEWDPTSSRLKQQGLNPNQYIITIESKVDGWSRYQVMANVLEAATQLEALMPPSTQY